MPSRSDLGQRRTARLEMRAVRPGDLDFLAAMFGDPAMTAHRPDPAPDSRERVAARLADDLGQWQALGFGRWLASDADGPVGTVGLSPAFEDDTLNIGYHLAPAAQGRGYATEMAAAALEVAFGPLAAEAVVALIRPANPASARVARRLGFRFVELVPLGGAPTRLYRLPRPLALSRPLP